MQLQFYIDYTVHLGLYLTVWIIV